MKYKIFVFDMDGTLLDSEKKISQKNFEAMKKLSESGVTLAVGTGRGLPELLDYKEELRGVRYGLLVNGGVVYDFFEKKAVSAKFVSLNDSLTVFRAANEERALLHIMTVEDSVARQEDIDHMEDFHMEIYHDMYERVCRRADDLEKFIRDHAEEITKLNVYHRSAESRDRSYQKIKNLNVSVAFAEDAGWEVTPFGVTKCDGLRFLCKYLGVNLSETAAIGDADNDSEILRSAGLSFAMGNATDEIKKICDVTVADSDHSGVAEAIEKYLLTA